MPSQVILDITTVIPLWISIPLGIFISISVVIYLVLLYAIVKYKNTPPFNTPFFTMTLHMGIFDLCHLFNDWVLGMLNYFGFYSFVLANSGFYAKMGSMVWWHTGLAQILGVCLMSIDRLMNIGFNKVSNLLII